MNKYLTEHLAQRVFRETHDAANTFASVLDVLYRVSGESQDAINTCSSILYKVSQCALAVNGISRNTACPKQQEYDIVGVPVSCDMFS